MAMKAKIEILGRETIKPSSPTPQHLRNFQLSLIDQTAPVVYIPLLLFYSANDDTVSPAIKTGLRSQHLKASLSKMLTQFYPLAGRIRDQTTIECNDEGVEYVEARVNCLLSDILEQPEPSRMRNFLPIAVESKEAEIGCLLLVQSTCFECGGMVIGMCISHKIADGSTLGTIIKSWSAAALGGSSNELFFPDLFKSASVFPPVLDSWIHHWKLIEDPCAVIKRYVFESSKMSALKARAASAAVQQPTRVEAVTALIWKCMIDASRSIKGFPRLSLISHCVNLRKKTVPPLPENSIGNMVGMFFPSHSTENEIDLQGLVCKLRKELTESNKTALQTINQEKKTWVEMSGINFAERDDIDYCTYSSWCRFPFYETDFGWGKPTWVTLAHWMIKNVVVLMDTRDGEGIEAFVLLGQEDAALFESQEELVEFAAFNPSVLRQAKRF